MSGLRYDRYWNEKYQIVKEYLDAHSGELPHKDLVYKGIKIRYWLYNQRRLLKREMTKESQERLKLLSELNSPISFEPNEKTTKAAAVQPEQEIHEQNWYKRYDELLSYINENSKIPNSREHPALYMWISRQRKKMPDGKLTDDQVSKLQKLGITAGKKSAD